MQPYISELEEYFAGKRREFTFPLDLRGTDFQLACWRALLAIPYGETRSYADIARAVGKPNAFRAVGMANNRNPDRDCRPLPSRDRLRWHALRLRRRPRRKTKAAGTRRRAEQECWPLIVL